MSLNGVRAGVAAAKIVLNLQGRAGIGDEWDMIDEDLQREIALEWAEIIEAELDAADTA